MKHLETNLQDSGFVPPAPINPVERPQPITSVNGHTIESLRDISTFQARCGNDLDRTIQANLELRNFITSDQGKTYAAYGNLNKSK